MFIQKLIDSIIQVTADGKIFVLYEADQRALVQWIAENRPDIIREIWCPENCKDVPK